MDEIGNRYGNLLDKYLDKATMDIEEKIRREEEAKTRYGNLLDKAKPDYTLYNDLMRCAEMCESMRQQREEEHEQARLRTKERIERQRREEEEHNARVTAFAESILGKKEAKRKAALEAMEKERREAEGYKRYFANVQALKEMYDYVEGASERTKKLIAYQERKGREHEERMAWLDSQENQRFGDCGV